MSAYVISGPSVSMALPLIMASTVLLGFAMIRCWSPNAARLFGWTLFVLGTIGVEKLCAHEPPLVRMMAIIGFALLPMKPIVAVEAAQRETLSLSFCRWLAFSAWPGMNPHIFSSRSRTCLDGTNKLIRTGVVRVALGFSFLVIAKLSWQLWRCEPVTILLLLVGLSLVLHFGICNLLAGTFRAVGFDCKSLFRAPLKSQSLTEFWGRRWNLAFSEMTSVAIYRPLSRRLGRNVALIAAFLFSGLVHEMAISVPVKAGFGLPMLYFTIHGGLTCLERQLARRGRPITGWFGRIWTVVWLVVPLPLLFHRPFIHGIVWPILGIPIGGR